MTVSGPAPEPASQPGSGTAPETLSGGPTARSGRTARIVGVVVLALLLVAALGYGGVRLYRARTSVVDLAELRTAYGAFLAADGRNLVTELQRPSGSAGENAGVSTTRPPQCAPLTAAPMQQEFPATALDGVSTFQDGGFDTSVSLFSYRFADRPAARRALAGIEEAATACDHTLVEVSEPISTSARADVLATEVQGADGTVDVTLTSRVDTSSFQITVARYKNVLNWEYSYHSGATAAVADHQLLQALTDRLISVDRAAGGSHGGS